MMDESARFVSGAAAQVSSAVQLKCLPTIPANSNIVTCGLPNTGSSLASALMAGAHTVSNRSTILSSRSFTRRHRGMCLSSAL